MIGEQSIAKVLYSLKYSAMKNEKRNRRHQRGKHREEEEEEERRKRKFVSKRYPNLRLVNEYEAISIR